MSADQTAPNRLAVYGTLAPGRANHHELEQLRGEWTTGRIRGRLEQCGWGAEQGCPGMVIDPTGDPIEVWVLTSDDLSYEWERLDLFEGEEYARQVVSVHTADGPIDAFIYLLA